MTQSARTRRQIRSFGGHFLYLAHVPRYFGEEFDEIAVELAELQLNLPLWEVIEEGEGSSRRVYVYCRFSGHRERVKLSSRESAVLSVMIKHNVITRTIDDWRALLENDPLFTSLGGPFVVPSYGTLKAYIDQRFEKALQKAFNKLHAGYVVNKVIIHERFGSKTVGYKIMGRLLD
jgi:hypothetical protein